MKMRRLYLIVQDREIPTSLIEEAESQGWKPNTYSHYLDEYLSQCDASVLPMDDCIGIITSYPETSFSRAMSLIMKGRL